METTTHAGFSRVFGARLSLGLFFPLEAYAGDVPRMEAQEDLARRAETLGFSALWFRDVPLRDPTFGDVGQIYDPWVYLAHVAAHTRTIALGTAAIVLPVRHPLHVAKAAASVDLLSGGRLILGVASGDRMRELEAFGVTVEARGENFRRHFELMRRAWGESFPSWTTRAGVLAGLDPLPKPALGAVPTVVAGRSQQTLAWIAQNADAWITYPRPLALQAATLAQWRRAVAEAGRVAPVPVAQSLYIDLDEDHRAGPRPIHLGWSLGRQALVEILGELWQLGVSHVALNLKYGRRPAREVIEELGEMVVRHFQRVDDEQERQAS